MYKDYKLLRIQRQKIQEESNGKFRIRNNYVCNKTHYFKIFTKRMKVE